jgi:hypothetical protein
MPSLLLVFSYYLPNETRRKHGENMDKTRGKYRAISRVNLSEIGYAIIYPKMDR